MITEMGFWRIVDFENAYNSLTKFCFIAHNRIQALSEVGEGRSSRPWDGGGGGRGSLPNFFRPLGPQFGLKIRGEPSSPGPSPSSATATFTPLKDHKVMNFCSSERNMNVWGGRRGER